MLTGRKVETLGPITGKITAADYSATFAASDPVSHEGNTRIAAKTVEQYGSVDIVVTAAGVNRPGAITEQPVDEWQMVMDVNVKGTYLMLKEAGKVMNEQGRGGKVIIVSSARSTLGMANYTAYCPSKAATDLLAKSRSCKWARTTLSLTQLHLRSSARHSRSGCSKTMRFTRISYTAFQLGDSVRPKILSGRCFFFRLKRPIL